MGAWDVTAFGNDDASDVILDLLQHTNPRDFLAHILARAQEAGYLEAPDGSQMIAAAALIAAANAKDSITVPHNVVNWVQANQAMLRPLAPAALEAVSRVRAEESELRELWQQSGELSAWAAELDRISAALL